MRWTWSPYHYPDERTPAEMRARNVAIIEHLSELDFGAFPPRSTSAGEAPLRGCTAKVLPDECAKLYPCNKGQCVRPIGAVPRGVEPGFLTDSDGKHPFCPHQVADWRPAPRVQTSHEPHAPFVDNGVKVKYRILTFLRRTVHSLALSEPEPLSSAARYYAPRTLHEHVNGVPVPAPGEALALELAERIRQVAASEKPWQRSTTPTQLRRLT